MTTGIYGIITDGEQRRDPCLLFGAGIPRIHHSDGVPVFHVIEHPDGFPVVMDNGTKAGEIKKLLAYPSHLPGPGTWSRDEWVYAYTEPMPFNALIPCFSGPSA